MTAVIVVVLLTFWQHNVLEQRFDWLAKAKKSNITRSEQFLMMIED